MESSTQKVALVDLLVLARATLQLVLDLICWSAEGPHAFQLVLARVFRDLKRSTKSERERHKQPDKDQREHQIVVDPLVSEGFDRFSDTDPNDQEREHGI